MNKKGIGLSVAIPLLAVLAISVFLPPAFAAKASPLVPNAAASGCPNYNGVSSAVQGNPGTGFSVSFTGTTSQKYSVTIPSNGDLLDYCVYPNSGVTTTVTSESSPISATTMHGTEAWTAGVSSNGYVGAHAPHGYDDVVGPKTNLEALDVTYSAAPSTLLIVLHVSDDSGSSAICSKANGGETPGTTCFILATGGVFPPPIPTPVFPLGTILALLVPLAAFGAFFAYKRGWNPISI